LAVTGDPFPLLTQSGEKYLDKVVLIGYMYPQCILINLNNMNKVNDVNSGGDGWVG
jgi:hypothetical protein